MAKAKRYDPFLDAKKPFFIKGLMLYILCIPLIFALFFSLFGGSSGKILTLAVATALCLLGATIARKGFLQEREYQKNSIAKAPKLKFKTISAIILAITTFFISFFATANG